MTRLILNQTLTKVLSSSIHSSLLYRSPRFQLWVREAIVTISLWLYSPCGPWSLFQFPNPYTVGRTPWTGDRSVARLLPTNRTTQTQNKRTRRHHASSGIRTHEASVRAGEDTSCIRPRGHCDRLPDFYHNEIIKIVPRWDKCMNVVENYAEK
jgi:hypothetical protein